MKCSQCERCLILWSIEFTALSKDKRIRILKEFVASKNPEFCMTKQEFTNLQTAIWEGYKHQLLMRDIKVKVELDKKLHLVKRFNDSFTEADVRSNSPRYLKALEDIETLFQGEFNKTSDAIITPKWKLIIRKILK